MNLEYHVIENQESASGLQLALLLTHTPSDQWDGRGAGDITPPLGDWPPMAKLVVGRISGQLIFPALESGPEHLKGSKVFPNVGPCQAVVAGMLLDSA